MILYEWTDSTRRCSLTIPHIVIFLFQNDDISPQIARQRKEIAKALKRKEEVAKEREARRKEFQARREEATRRRQELAKRKQSGKETIAVATSTGPGSFFGSMQSIAEVKRWNQNSDGSITGYIYKSKSFEDGTRITTSAVPKGAKRGTVVKTSGGTRYFLR
jgi:chromosome segregation ATPase